MIFSLYMQRTLKGPLTLEGGMVPQSMLLLLTTEEGGRVITVDLCRCRSDFTVVFVTDK